MTNSLQPMKLRFLQYCFINYVLDRLKQLSMVASLEDLAYRDKTVFGYVTLFDPRRIIKQTVFTEEGGIPCMGLDEGEKLVLDYLISGRSYASTGMSTDLYNTGSYVR